MALFFAADFHGSNAAFRKFINAAVHFRLRTLAVGGDLTGKVFVPIVRRGFEYLAEFQGRQVRCSTETEVRELEKHIAMAGQYPFRTTEDEYHTLQQDQERQRELMITLMRRRLEEWFDLARDRLRPLGARLLVIWGNDDPVELDAPFSGHDFAEFIDGKVTHLDGEIEVVGFGGSNPTPWASPREYSEEEFGARLTQIVSRLHNPNRSIWIVHVPPYESGVDLAPQIDRNWQVVYEGGQPRLVSVGSRSLRDLICNYQPLATLHGHVHESRGVGRVGKTLVVNPGSEYGEGVLRAATLRLDRRGNPQVQFMSA